MITEYAGRLNRWDVAYGGRRFAHLAWRDMRRWQARGITFESHTATHPRLTWLPEEDAARDARLEVALNGGKGVFRRFRDVVSQYPDLRARWFMGGPTDLKIGLIGGGRVKTHFLLPNGSDLAVSLMERRDRYGVVNLTFLWENPLRKRLEPRLFPTGRTGEYYFVHRVQKMLGHAPNLVVIGNERYPDRTAPGSVAEFLGVYL